MTMVSRRTFLRNVAAVTALAAVGAKTAAHVAKERAACGLDAWLPAPGGQPFSLDRAGDLGMRAVWDKAIKRMRNERPRPRYLVLHPDDPALKGRGL